MSGDVIDIKKRARSKSAQPQQQKPREQSPELAYAEYIARDNNIASDGSILYRWNGKIWQPVEPSDAERAAFEWLGASDTYRNRATPKTAASCVSAAILKAQALPRNKSNDVLLPLRNCYLRITESGEIALEQHNKNAGLTYLIDCDFDINARAEQFSRFLESVQPDAEVRAWIQAYVGYTLLPDTRFQKACFWLGSGANGKSTLAEIVAALHAKTSAMTLDRLESFQLVSLIGTSLVYVDETPARIDEQRLKALISGGLVQIDRKFRDPINLRPTAKWIICGNALPAISDQSHGFWRRMPVVVFERQFAEHEQDPLLAQRIIKNELSGVLLWAVAGLVECLKAGRLPPLPAAMQRALDDSKRETNSVLAWFDDDRIEYDADAFTPRAEIYRDYQAWTRERGYSPVNETKFWMRMRMIDAALAVPLARKINGAKIRGAAARLLHNNTAGQP